MNKKTATEVLELYAECLRNLYKKAGIEVSPEFNPEIEANRIFEEICCPGRSEGKGGIHLTMWPSWDNTLPPVVGHCNFTFENNPGRDALDGLLKDMSMGALYRIFTMKKWGEM